MTEDVTGIGVTEYSDRPSPPVWFWVISILAALWYLLEVWGFYRVVSMTDDVFRTMPEDQQRFYQNMPLWVNTAFAGEVFGGVLGCLALLLSVTLRAHCRCEGFRLQV